MEVREGKELFGERHRKPKTGNDSSFYMFGEETKEDLLHPSGYRRRNSFGWAEFRASTKAFASRTGFRIS